MNDRQIKTDLCINSFQKWACGNLADNRNRGIFAEWLVGLALGVVEDDKPRREWDACDFRYGDDRAGREATIEVKASGLRQSWIQEKDSIPRFSIEKQKETWDADTNEWETCDPPRRSADIYVFCLHEGPGNNDSVADLSQWNFWVVPTTVINERLGDQASLGRGTLNKLASPVRWNEIKTTVNKIMNRANEP